MAELPENNNCAAIEFNFDKFYEDGFFLMKDFIDSVDIYVLTLEDLKAIVEEMELLNIVTEMGRK
jgi:hypothetical protein